MEKIKSYAFDVPAFYICIMDKNISSKIKALIADNKLEEALDIMIRMEQSKSQERHNTLILLKGKLEMLEEQELADLLEFEDLSREKRKIAHALLKTIDDDSTDVPQSAPSQKDEIQKTIPTPSKDSSGFSRYLLPLLLIVGVVLGIAYFTNRPTSEKNDLDRQEQTDKQKEQKSDTSKPTKNEGELRLIDFPNIGRPFNFSDIQYHFKDVQVEKYSDTEIKLILKMDLTCRNNSGICYREETRIIVNGNPIAPTERKAWEGYLEHNASTNEELVFVFPEGENYRLLLEKNSSTWERAFKIIK